jgi:hypothetical protein
LEQRSNFLISTLRSYEAMGGQLSLVAEVPNCELVILSGIAIMGSERSVLLRRHHS